jgi:acyl carrier protein
VKSDQLESVFRDVLGLKEGEFREDLRLENIPSWDSVVHLSLVLTLEQTFGVMFEPEEAAAMKSVADIRAALAAKGVA